MEQKVALSSDECDVAEQYDLALVFEVPQGGDEEKDKKREEMNVKAASFLQILHSDGDLQYLTYKTKVDPNAKGELVICLIRARDKRLKDQADFINYDLEIDHLEGIEFAKKKEIKLALLTLDEDIMEVNADSWKAMYGPYKGPEKETLYRKYGENKSIFRKVDRIKLLFIILEAEKRNKGCNLRIPAYTDDPNHPLVAIFPLHDAANLKIVEKAMNGHCTLCNLPLRLIRDYFGEQIAMYFAFLQFYTKYLSIPAFFGTVVFAWQVAVGLVNVYALPVFAALIAVWATMFLEMWKRRQSRLRGQWGMADFLEKEQARPDFEGDWRVSAIDGSQEEYYPRKKQIQKCLVSHSIILTMIASVISSVVGVYILKYFLLTQWGHSKGSAVSSVVASLNIMIFNALYGYIATALNDWENHRTDTIFENAKIAKVFMFKFVNSYAILFYLAFAKKYDKAIPCLPNDPSCLLMLRKQLMVIFIMQIVVNNTLEIVLPKLKKKMSKKKLHGSATQVEKDFLFKDTYDSTFDDFDEITIQYGYCILFVLAFPLTPLLALINNLVENYVDAKKIIHESRRPEPKGAADIGTWETIFSIFGYVAVITNVALIIDNSDPGAILTGQSMTVKFMVFIGMEHLLFFLKFAVAYFIDDVPMDEINRIDRNQFLVDVLLKDAVISDDEAEFDDPGKKLNADKEAKQLARWFNKNGLEEYLERFQFHDTYNTLSRINAESDHDKMCTAVGITSRQDKEKIENAMKADNTARAGRNKKLLATYYNLKGMSTNPRPYTV